MFIKSALNTTHRKTKNKTISWISQIITMVKRFVQKWMPSLWNPEQAWKGPQSLGQHVYDLEFETQLKCSSIRSSGQTAAFCITQLFPRRLRTSPTDPSCLFLQAGMVTMQKNIGLIINTRTRPQFTATQRAPKSWFSQCNQMFTLSPALVSKNPPHHSINTVINKKHKMHP